jgi:hypothetical protein
MNATLGHMVEGVSSVVALVSVMLTIVSPRESCSDDDPSFMDGMHTSS